MAGAPRISVERRDWTIRPGCGSIGRSCRSIPWYRVRKRSANGGVLRVLFGRIHWIHEEVMRQPILWVLVSLCASASNAQAPTATLAGHVTDPSQAVIVDASIRLIDTETNVRHDTTTNNSGEYHLTNLHPGPYRLEIRKPGFRTLVKPDIIVHVQDTLTIDLEMAIGEVSETTT